jgi:hypothetical protein
MKKARVAVLVAVVAALCGPARSEADGGGWGEHKEQGQAVGTAAKLPADLAGLAGRFGLGGPLKPDVRYYIQVTDYVSFGFDGRRTSVATFTVKMKVVPEALSHKGGDEYTVREFSVRTGNGEAETIPSLAGWSYVFRPSASGRDEKGQILGIPHDKFEGLVTNTGRKIAPVASYPISASSTSIQRRVRPAVEASSAFRT